MSPFGFVLPILFLIIGAVPYGYARKRTTSIRIGQPKNHCDAKFHIDINVRLIQRITQDNTNTSNGFHLKMHICRSSWDNKFCRQSLSSWRAQGCRLVKIKQRRHRAHYLYKCSLDKYIFCMFKAPGARWNMATYVIMFKTETVESIPEDRLSLTPFLLLQQCSNTLSVLASSDDCSIPEVKSIQNFTQKTQGSGKANFKHVYVGLAQMINKMLKVKDSTSTVGNGYFTP